MLTTALLGSVIALGQVPTGAFEIKLGESIKLNLCSEPVKYQGNDLSIVRFTSVKFVFHESEQSFFPNSIRPLEEYEISRAGHELKAKVELAVSQYNDVDYRLSGAVFDREGKLLGTDSRTIRVSYVRLGIMPTTRNEVTFEFGSSQTYKTARYAVFTINQPVVPVPPDGH